MLDEIAAPPAAAALLRGNVVGRERAADDELRQDRHEIILVPILVGVAEDEIERPRQGGDELVGVGDVFGPNLAGMIADSTGSYARAYQVAGGLLLFAALLDIWSHMHLSFKLADKQLVITLGRRESSDKREPGEEEQDTLVA